MEKRNFPCYSHRYLKKPLKIYDLECVLSVIVLIEKFTPLRIMIFNEGFISLIEGPYFVEKSKDGKAGMGYEELITYLTRQGWSREKIDEIWDKVCQYCIYTVLSIQHEFDLREIEDRTY